MMKKKHLITVALLSLVLAFGSLFAACAPTEGNENIATYTVRFNNNYDGTVTKVEVESGKTLALPAEPSRTGYIFKGWYTEYGENASVEFDATKPVVKDTTVFAKWERNDSVSLVTFKYMNLRTQDKIVSVNKGTQLERPENPKFDDNEMYAFNGWYTESDCKNAYDFTQSVNDDITLYAGWTADKTTVEFDANFAGAPAPTKTVVKLGTAVAKPEDPERAMNEFGGWFTGRVGGTQYDFSSPVTEATTLYAHWLRSEYVVTFNVNGAPIDSGADFGEGSVSRGKIQYTIKRGASAEQIAANIISKLGYEGHKFVGWYNRAVDAETGEPSDAREVSLSSIGDDMTVYAKWELETYEVKFDLNYESAPAAPETQTVKYGKQATEPEKPTRAGYRLVGWYREAAGTTQFTFDMPVTGNLTLYARWMDNSQAGGTITVTYNYKTDGANVVHATTSVESLGTAASSAPANPKVDGWLFVGWFEDEAFTKEFNMNATLTDDVAVYGKMLKGYTLEAEKVDFTEKRGQGTSTNSFEEQMIYGEKFIGDGTGKGDSFVSGGMFVRELYYNGAFLEFEFTVDEEVEDAVMVLRVSSESYEFMKTQKKDGKVYNYLNEEEFKIIVNSTNPDDRLSYGGLLIPMANLVEKEDLSNKKTPFENMEIAVKLHLNKGVNKIVLLVDNNNNHGGTFHAEAPMIDCMYIYASTGITQNDYGFDTLPGVNLGN